MEENIAYPNKNLGKNGWFYWALFPLIGGSIAFVSTFLFSTSLGHYDVAEKSAMLAGTLFFAYYALKAVQVLWLGTKTAKNIIVTNHGLAVTTYIGTSHLLKNFSKADDVTDKLSQGHLRLLFPVGCKVLAVASGTKTYYLPVTGDTHLQRESQ